MQFWLLLKKWLNGFLEWLGYTKEKSGYQPQPTQPSYIPHGQTISDQTIGDNSFCNKQYLINADKVTIIDSDKKSDANKTSSE